MKKRLYDLMKDLCKGRGNEQEVQQRVLSLIKELGLLEDEGTFQLDFKEYLKDWEIGSFKSKSDINTLNEINIFDEMVIYLTDKVLVHTFIYDLKNEEIRFEGTEKSIYSIEKNQ